MAINFLRGSIMIKRKMMFILLLFFFVGGLERTILFQSCILASDSKRSEEMSEEQKKELKSRLQELKRQDELKQKQERRRKQEVLRRKTAKLHPEIARKREPLWLQSDQRRQEFNKEVNEAGGRRFLQAKYGLCVSEEQWKLIRPKLEKVINLWDQANSTVGAGVSGGSSNNQKQANLPKLQWERPWKYKPLFEMTEAQRLAEELRILLEKKNTPTEAFRRKVAALREARSKEAEITKQLTEGRGE